MSTTEKLKDSNKKIKSFVVNCIKLYKNTERETIKTRRDKIKVQPWTTIRELKTIISGLNNVHSKNIRLFFEKFELKNDLSMNDYRILEKKHPKIFYEIIENDKENRNFEIKVYGTFPCCDALKKIIRKIYYAFAAGLNPVVVEDGTSGTYKLRNPEKEVVGIFKPLDEEPFAPNNNKDHVGDFGSETFRKGILSGEGTFREVAAYILDLEKKDKGDMVNIFDVPPTTLVEISHPFFNKNNEEMLYVDEDIDNILKNGLVLKFLNEKISHKKDIKHLENKQPYLTSKKYNYIRSKYGSLQKFVESTGVVADYSYSLFTIEEAHKIMILDFRILNCDRNDENILLIKEPNKKKNNNKKDFYKLIPIDHALSFPSCLKIGDYEMCWMTWSQAEQPFTKKEKEYIENIDIISDMQRLNENINLREDCWKYFRISNTVLKVGAKYDLTPFEIGSLMYTLDYDKKEPSKIELIIQKTDNLCSCLKVDKRLRLFSAGSKEETEPEERQNKFARTHYKRISLLERTTSEPKKNANEDSGNSSNDEYSGLKSNGNIKNKKKELQLSRASSVSQEIVFDSPYNEMYFSHFIIFLKELIKAEYPEKAKIYEENLEIEEEKNLKNYEYNLNIIETNKDFFDGDIEG